MGGKGFILICPITYFYIFNGDLTISWGEISLFVWRDNESVDWIPINVWKGLDEDKIVCLSVPVISLAVLIMRYKLFLAVIEVSNMTERGVPNYGL